MMLDRVSQLLHILLDQFFALFFSKQMAKDWLKVMTHVFEELDVVAILLFANNTNDLFLL